jgi:cytosine deaminase
MNRFQQIGVIALSEKQMLRDERDRPPTFRAMQSFPVARKDILFPPRLPQQSGSRCVQQGDPSLHGETDAFRNAGRQRSYRKLLMVTTLAPCWYCSGLVRQFGFRTVVVGESRNFQGGIDWLRSLGVQVIDLDSQECVSLLADYIRANPTVWNEDIGEE